MKIEKNKVVSLAYSLRLDNKEGSLVEETTPERPFVFLFGAGTVLPKFEENLNGLTKTEEFSFSLLSEEGYGQPREDAIMDLPMNIFEVEGKVDMEMLKEGNIIPMQDQQGNVMQGKVVKVGLESVSMDFNHPMAGKDLYFSGHVVDVRDATEEELSHGHAHGPEGHQH